MSRAWFIAICSLPLASGLFVLAMGRDANWDFLNYRWYTPYGLLQGRLLRDVLVSGHATFFNPVLELPFYLVASNVPSMVAGFYLGIVDGLPFIALASLAVAVLPFQGGTRKLAFAVLVALSGMVGGGVLGQIGIVSWDVPLGLLPLTACALLMHRGQRALAGPLCSGWRWIALAGFLAGCAPGLKLTAAVFPLGLVAAIAVSGNSRLKDRFFQVVIFSAGTVAGILLCGGYWMARLYLAYGNPLFPFFNGMFHSPFASAGDNRDATFLPAGWLQAIIFPFYFSRDSHLVAEYSFRDIHIALAYFLVPVALAIRRARRRSTPSALPFLATFFFVSYFAWEGLFSIYRYILPLEMIAPILIVLALGECFTNQKAWLAATLCVLVVAQALAVTTFNRRPWGGHYVEVHMPFEIPPHATIIMKGGGPMGYVVPYLPVDSQVLRIDSPLRQGTAFDGTIRDRLDVTDGPLFILSHNGESAATLQAGFTATGQCGLVTSNVDDPLQLCKAVPR